MVVEVCALQGDAGALDVRVGAVEEFLVVWHKLFFASHTVSRRSTSAKCPNRRAPPPLPRAESTDSQGPGRQCPAGDSRYGGAKKKRATDVPELREALPLIVQALLRVSLPLAVPTAKELGASWSVTTSHGGPPMLGRRVRGGDGFAYIRHGRVARLLSVVKHLARLSRGRLEESLIGQCVI